MAKAEVKGLQKATKSIRKIEAKMRKATRAAVNTEAEFIMSEALKQVPRITGDLALSKFVREMDGKNIKAILGFSIDYAFEVHENPRPASSNGKWKYLEDPMKAAAPGYAQRVAERAKKIAGL